MDDFTTKDYELIIELTSKCKNEDFFSYEGLLVKGLYVHIVKQYVKESPSVNFGTWLINKRLTIETKTIDYDMRE